MSNVLQIKTKGNYDFIDLTVQINKIITQNKFNEGVCFVFVKGTTCALTIMEFEKGTKKDLIELFEKIAPQKKQYHHHMDWGDYNGDAHVKSTLLNINLTIPVDDKKLNLGKWQKIVLVDFDDKKRNREIIVKLIK